MSDIGQQINLCWNKVIDIIVNYQYWLLLDIVTGYCYLYILFTTSIIAMVNCTSATSVTLGSFSNDDGDAEDDDL